MSPNQNPRPSGRGGHQILSNLPDHLAELVALINGIVHPEHGARSFGRKHIEVYRDASCVDDFEAYQLRVHPTRSGRIPDPPAVHRVDAVAMWQDCTPKLVPAPRP